MGKKRIFDEDEAGDAEEISQQVDYEINRERNPPKVTKPLPEGYVCNACGAVGEHAIYNCPMKVSKKKQKTSTNASSSSSGVNVAARDESVNDESEPTIFPVFVSGLSFDMTKIKLIDMIKEANNTEDEESKCDLTPKDIILLSFPDNPNKCNGLAYVNCTNMDDYNRALKLNGTPCGKMKLSAVPSTQETKKHKAEDNRKEKKLRIKSEIKHCYRCGGDHDPKTCTNPRICYRCRATDHLSSQCPKKKGHA